MPRARVHRRPHPRARPTAQARRSGRESRSKMPGDRASEDRYSYPATSSSSPTIRSGSAMGCVTLDHPNAREPRSKSEDCPPRNATALPARTHRAVRRAGVPNRSKSSAPSKKRLWSSRQTPRPSRALKSVHERRDLVGGRGVGSSVEPSPGRWAITRRSGIDRSSETADSRWKKRCACSRSSSSRSTRDAYLVSSCRAAGGRS